MPACGTCGYSRIEDDTRFCPRCGEPIAEGNANALPMGVSPASLAEPKSNQEMNEGKAALCELPPHADQNEAAGGTKMPAPRIGGWLYIPAVHLILLFAFYLIAFGIIILSALFLENKKNLLFLNSVSFTAYGYSFFALYFALLIYVVKAFFQRKRTAPVAIKVLFFTAFVNDLIEIIWWYSLIDISSTTLLFSPPSVFSAKNLVPAIVYTIAFRRSKRAKATFIN
jgi:hypothetical protein